ncbi:hypothetical protein [Thermosulfuriphilus sp.]
MKERGASLIIRVKDAFTGEKPSLPFRCFIKEASHLEGRCEDGLVVFFEIPSFPVTVAFRSPYFRDKDFRIKDRPRAPLEITLYPSELYPFPEGATLFKGGVVDQNEYPIAGARVCLRWAGGICQTVTDDYGCFVLFPGPGEKKKWRNHHGIPIIPGPEGRLKVKLTVTAPGYRAFGASFIWPAGKSTCQEIELSPEKD